MKLRLRLEFLGILAGIVFYGLSVAMLSGMPHRGSTEEMRLGLPLFAQVLLAGGDRHLAANMATLRALLSPAEGMDEGQYRILARIQKDASFLNPAQQDNYYLAAAFLPWNRQVDSAQRVLRRAHDARPFDLWPAFYHGFNTMHFQHQPLEGARWLRLAAARAPDVEQRYALDELAARWSERHDDLKVALGIVRGMAEETRDAAFKAYLMKRVARLEQLQDLRQAAIRYREIHGRGPAQLADLVRSGQIEALPQDPFNLGFAIKANGEIVFREALAHGG